MNEGSHPDSPLFFAQNFKNRQEKQNKIIQISKNSQKNDIPSLKFNYTNVLAEKKIGSIIKHNFFRKNSEFIKKKLVWKREEGELLPSERPRKDDEIKLSAFSLRNLQKALPTLLYS